jgi:hypothetical protein
MNGRSLRLWQYGLGGLVATAVTLAACGDDDDAPNPGTGGAAGRGSSGAPGAGSAGSGGSGTAGKGQAGGASGGSGAGSAGVGGTGGAPPVAGLPGHVRSLVTKVASGEAPGVEFPVKAGATDVVRALPGLVESRVVSWLDPLTADEDFAKGAPFFGANNDYIAYFGEGWNANAGDPPQWHGSGDAAWLWVNHEYMSNGAPALNKAPTGQHAVLATFLNQKGVIETDPNAQVWSQGELDAYVNGWKRQVGGSWVRVTRDAAGKWSVDRSAPNVRYDATSATQSLLTGHALVAADRDDAGTELPASVVAGTNSNCSGGQAPWGTVVSAEENFQFAYGDVELGWSDSKTFDPAKGLGAGKTIAFTAGAADPAQGLMSVATDPNSDFGRSTAGRHNSDNYGYLVEFDPGAAPGQYFGKGGEPRGHKKIGYLGRARWENATFAVGADWKPLPGKRVVVYSSDDRRGGRIYKFVSSAPYQAGMTPAQARALLDDGDLYVAHFEGLDNVTGKTLAATGNPPDEANPGTGRWIRLSVDNVTDDAPNAAALGAAGTKVGAALKSLAWNGVGGFADDDAVRRLLFTASNKIGVKELNRPEDIEWNPRDPSGKPRLYVAFTNHNRVAQLDADGKLRTEAQCAGTPNPCNRNDALGSIFSLEEAAPDDPAASATFAYRAAFLGSVAEGDDYAAANPDNLLIDPQGGVWFGTDGNFGASDEKGADGVYYLDLDPAHAATTVKTYGKAFRVLSVPSDAEATGPALSSDAHTLFVAVQHPGEEAPSDWPDGTGKPPRSSVIALYLAP